jgi:hypothetical protein
MASLNGKNILVIALLVVVCGGLFFVPEILRLRGGGSSEPSKEIFKDGKKRPTHFPVHTTSILQKKPPQPLSDEQRSVTKDLDQILTNFETGQYSNTPVTGRGGNERVIPTDLERVLSGAKISWSTLQTRQIIRLVSARVGYVEGMLANLPRKYAASHQALRDYIEAFTAFRTKDAPAYGSVYQFMDRVTELDYKVTQAMSDELVPQHIYGTWKNTSLSPLVDPIVSKKRHDYVPPFAADLALTDVSITRLGNFIKGRQEYSVSINVAISVGENADFEIWRRGEKIHSAKVLANQLTSQPWTLFTGTDGRSVESLEPYVLRLTNSRGGWLEKHYSFYNRRRRFVGRQGYYKLPVVPRYDLSRAVDRRIDVQFFTGYVRGSAMTLEGGSNEEGGFFDKGQSSSF